MTEQELHYLKSILGNLREFRGMCDFKSAKFIGYEVLNDNIDWLDCFVEKNERERKNIWRGTRDPQVSP